jgi:hypothetical protein
MAAAVAETSWARAIFGCEENLSEQS